MCAKSLQSCPTLCDAMNCNPPGSSVHGILQTRKLKWLAVLSSRGSSWPRDQTYISYSPALEGWFLNTSTTMWAKCKENEYSRRVQWHGRGEEKKLSLSPDVWREKAKKPLWNPKQKQEHQISFFNFHWTIVDLQCCVSLGINQNQCESVIHIHSF